MTAADFFLLTTLLATVATVVALIYAHQEHEQAVEARQWAERIAADRLSADLRACYAAERIAADMRRRETAANMEAAVAAHNLNAQKPGIHAIPGSILSLPRHTVTPSQFSRN